MEKNEELLHDATADGFSSCCGAKVYLPDICSDCQEHCSIEKVYECIDCHDTGEIKIPAEQIYDQHKGTIIRDEYTVLCHCKKPKIKHE